MKLTFRHSTNPELHQTQASKGQSATTYRLWGTLTAVNIVATLKHMTFDRHLELFKASTSNSSHVLLVIAWKDNLMLFQSGKNRQYYVLVLINCYNV